MDKTFKTDLSVKGINKLKKQLIQYRDVKLRKKLEQYVSELLRLGINVAQTNINESPLGKYVALTTDISSDKMGCKGILIAIGQNKESEGREPFNTLLAIEFGAGIYYNSSENPKSAEMGFGVGTFPGQIHAFEDGWYYWDENASKWRYTHGVKATMPMYKADIEIIAQAVSVARKIFRK